MKPQTIANLDKIVLAGLDFFSINKPHPLKLKDKDIRFIVGSVNAYNTGRMLFNDQAVIFADEGNFLALLKTYKNLIKEKKIKEAIIISASGEKDSIWEIKAAKRAGLKTTLLTCSDQSSAAKLADKSYFFRKISEPYSYNFSTYLGMLLSHTQEDPKKIKEFLLALKIPKKFKNSRYFSFILPDRFKAVAEMIKVKDEELFGPYSSLRAYPEGSARHAKFICQAKDELIISFGKNPYFGNKQQRWEITWPKNGDYGLALSLSYFLCGLIQTQKPDHFKKGLPNYCLKTGPAPYKQKKPFNIIVPGN